MLPGDQTLTGLCDALCGLLGVLGQETEAQGGEVAEPGSRLLLRCRVWGWLLLTLSLCTATLHCYSALPLCTVTLHWGLQEGC